MSDMIERAFEHCLTLVERKGRYQLVNGSGRVQFDCGPDLQGVDESLDYYDRRASSGSSPYLTG